MSLETSILKVQKIVVKNAPTILAVAGSVFAAASVGLAVNGTLKAQKELEKHERELKGEKYYAAREAQCLIAEGVTNTDICKQLKVKVVTNPEEATEYVTDLVEMPTIDFKDKVLIYTKHYAPSVIFLGLSIFCILSGNHISKRRILELTGALALSKKSLDEYKVKVEELVGKKKAAAIKEAVTQENILKNPATEANTAIPPMGNMPNLSLWYDTVSDRYFYSNIDYIRKAEFEAQRLLDKNGSVSMNDVYAVLGLKEIPLGEEYGWYKDINGVVMLETGAVLDDHDNPVGTLSMDVRPSSAWLSEV